MSILSPQSLSGWEILVIDDEEDSLEVARHILSYYGAKVHLARNGQEGWDLLDHIKPRFIITDLSMPIMDGWTLIKKIKRDPHTRHIPVIALTAHAMHDDRKRAIAAGFHNYIAKPLTANVFIRDLLNLLDDIPELSDELRMRGAS